MEAAEAMWSNLYDDVRTTDRYSTLFQVNRLNSKLWGKLMELPIERETECTNYKSVQHTTKHKPHKASQGGGLVEAYLLMKQKYMNFKQSLKL